MTPNQAIRNSVHNALIITISVGLVAGLGLGLVVGLVAWLVLGMRLGLGLVAGLPFGLPFGLVMGLYAGMIFGLRYGGNAVIQHYTLRLLLSRYNIIPFARDKVLIDFLDKMVERILLRRVGGGWVFIHRYLLEHFAALHEESAS